MSAHPQLSREEIAKREIGVTTVTSAQAWTLVLVFLSVLYTVPVAQWVIDRKGPEVGPTFGFHDVIRAFRLGVLPRTVSASEADEVREAGLLRRCKVANDQMLVNIHGFEDELKSSSFLTTNLVTGVQRLTTRTIGLGNEKGYPGRDGWAFFRTGVDALTGPGFLEPRQLERRAASGTEWVPAPKPDPRPAIREFHRYLASRGIDLILVPAPNKPGIHPERLSGRFDGAAPPIRNPSFQAWADELVAAGVTLVDPAERMVELKAGGDVYLETDTHWTPGAMEAVAELIADTVDLEPGTAGYRRGSREVAALGDVAANLLQLEGTGVYPEQTVTIHPVMTDDGEPWSADPDADILLLGDSFANIYSATNMNWGGGAGLAEQLSFQLQRPVDVIVENDSGARATRLALAKALHRGDRLAGKQVVVWEFAARELAVGDWEPIDWDGIAIPETSAVAPVSADSVKIEGRIEAISRSPRPGTVTYKDCIVQIHLVDVEGLDGVDELLLNLWGMRDNRLTESEAYKAGDRRGFQILDWEQAQARHGLAGIMRRELDDPDFALIALDLYWAE